MSAVRLVGFATRGVSAHFQFLLDSTDRLEFKERSGGIGNLPRHHTWISESFGVCVSSLDADI